MKSMSSRSLKMTLCRTLVNQEPETELFLEVTGNYKFRSLLGLNKRALQPISTTNLGEMRLWKIERWTHNNASYNPEKTNK